MKSFLTLAILILTACASTNSSQTAVTDARLLQDSINVSGAAKAVDLYKSDPGLLLGDSFQKLTAKQKIIFGKIYAHTIAHRSRYRKHISDNVDGIDNRMLEAFVNWHKSSLGRKYSGAMNSYLKNPQSKSNSVKPMNAKIIRGWGESSTIVSRQKALMSFLLTALVYTDNKAGRPLKLQDTSVEAAVEQLAPAQMQMWVDQMTEIYGSMDTDNLIEITNFMNSKEFQEYQSRVTLGYRQARAELAK